MVAHSLFTRNHTIKQYNVLLVPFDPRGVRPGYVAVTVRQRVDGVRQEMVLVVDARQTYFPELASGDAMLV